jgi:membrane associated rhomboid family serine protease
MVSAEQTGEAATQRLAEAAIDSYRKDMRFVRLLSQPAVVTRGLVILLLGCFAASYAFDAGVIQRYVGAEQGLEPTFVIGAKVNAAIAQGELWRLVTSSLLHLNLIHLGFNIYGLYALGGIVERLVGGRRFAVLYGLSGLGGAVASYLFHQTASVGASGAVFGVLGAAVTFGWRRGAWVPQGVGKALTRGLLPWLVLNVVIGLVSDMRIDNAAHLGGLVMGSGLGLLMGSPLSGQAPTRWSALGWKVGVWAMVALLGAALVGLVFGARRCLESEAAWHTCQGQPQLERTP